MNTRKRTSKIVYGLRPKLDIGMTKQANLPNNAINPF
jgi:hypothetical protein